MTRRSSFREPKKVLIFNEHRILVSVNKSLHVTTQLLMITSQTISLCCTGQRISSNGFYFRHSHQNVKIDVDEDIGYLTLEEYDQMCDVIRQYHSPSEMKNRRIKAGRINKRSTE